jgi:hypothetical protein
MRFLFLALLLCGWAPALRAQSIYNITTYGAVGNGSTDNTTAIQRAIDSCTAQGGGLVWVPQGTFQTRTLRLKDNVTLYLAQGATLRGDGTPGNYPDITAPIRNYTDNNTRRSLLYAENARNIGLRGPGTLDGNGQAIGMLLDRDNRPYGIRFYSCTNVRIDSVRLRQSGWWFAHLFNCDSVEVSHIDMYNHATGNNDGFDFDCSRNVYIHHSKLDCNNDPIVLKGTAPLLSRNFLAENCTLSTLTRCIKIGTETNGDFRNIAWRNITVTRSSVPLAVWPAAGINLSIHDGGTMDSVRVENVTIEGCSTALTIRLANRARKHEPNAPTPGVGVMRNLVLKNIRINSLTNNASYVTAIPGHYLQNVQLENVEITMPGGLPAADPNLVVPEREVDRSEWDLFGTTQAYGLFVRHVQDLRLDSVCIRLLAADGRQKFYFDDTAGIAFGDTCATRVTARAVSEISGLKLYPNPAQAGFWVQAPAARLAIVRLWNMLGEAVAEWNTEGRDRMWLALPSLAAGLYRVEVQTLEGFCSTHPLLIGP